jgi:hypothetical protein
VRFHDGGAAAQLDRVAFHAHRHRLQPHRTALNAHVAQAHGRIREGYLLAVRRMPWVADLERVRAGAGADGKAARGIRYRRRHEVTSTTVAVVDLYDGTAQGRAFRAGGYSHQHDLGAVGGNAVMFMLRRRRCEYGS